MRHRPFLGMIVTLCLVAACSSSNNDAALQEALERIESLEQQTEESTASAKEREESTSTVESEVTVKLATSSDEVRRLEQRLTEKNTDFLELSRYTAALEKVFKANELCRMSLVVFVEEANKAESLYSTAAQNAFSFTALACSTYGDLWDEFKLEHGSYSQLASDVTKARREVWGE